MRKVLLGLVLLSVPLSVSAGRYSRAVERIPDQYLIMLKDSVSRNDLPQLASSLTREHAGKIIAVMNSVGNLFAATLTEDQARRLAENPLVELVEEAAVVHISSQQTFPPYESLEDPTVNPRTPGLSKWHLDRIDQSGASPTGVYNYCEKAGDVYAYMPDLGAWRDHVEFANNPSRIKEGVAKMPRRVSCQQISPVKVRRLRIERTTNPMGMELQPRASWAASSSA